MAANSRSIVLTAAVFTYSPSTLIVDRHGYHSDVVAAAVQRGSHVVKKSHAARSNRLSLKAAASVRHDGVSSFRSRSADAGKTIVVLFVVACLFFASVTQGYLVLVHTSVAFMVLLIYLSVFTCALIMQLQPGQGDICRCHGNILTRFSHINVSKQSSFI